MEHREVQYLPHPLSYQLSMYRVFMNKIISMLSTSSRGEIMYGDSPLCSNHTRYGQHINFFFLIDKFEAPACLRSSCMPSKSSISEHLGYCLVLCVTLVLDG